MFIGVLEKDVSRISGRMRTMVQFADAFKQMGHEVKLLTEFKRNEIKLKKDLFKYHETKYLEKDDVKFYHDISPYNLPPLYMYDVVMVPYPRFAVNIKVPTISWWIDGPAIDSKDRIIFYWTNSYTSKRRLDPKGIFDVRVVYPPHDYSVFRHEAMSVTERVYDLATVGRVGEKYGALEKFAKICYEYGMRGIIIALVSVDRHKELLDKLSHEYGVEYVYNLPRSKFAKYLAASKVYLHLSEKESCSLAIYEAMNAGCFPVVYDAGAAREQVGDVGIVFKDYTEIDIREIVYRTVDRQRIIDRGRKFDRINVLDRIKEELEEVEDAIV